MDIQFGPGIQKENSTSSSPRTVTNQPDHNQQFPELIDNRNLLYLPVPLRCGVTAMCRDDVLSTCPMVLDCLNSDIEYVLSILPKSVHALVRRTNVFLNTSFEFGLRDNPTKVNYSTAHHEAGWLIWCLDRVEKTRSIEIYDCFEYFRARTHWNGPGLILHEFCHLIHQFALPNGLDNSNVKRLHKRAKESGIYDLVLRRDWAKRKQDQDLAYATAPFDLAYATVNHKEFFAEMSVSFLANFYHHLDSATMRDGMQYCCPPLYESDKQNSSYTGSISLIRQHCNKFFPFTKGQLMKFDEVSYSGMSMLWDVIEAWVDDESFSYDADSGGNNRNHSVKGAEVEPKYIEFDGYVEDEIVSL